MKHRASQFEIPGAEQVFNLVGEKLIQEAPKPKQAADLTRAMFTCGKIRFPMGPCQREWDHLGNCDDQQPKNKKP